MEARIWRDEAARARLEGWYDRLTSFFEAPRLPDPAAPGPAADGAIGGSDSGGPVA